MNNIDPFHLNAGFRERLSQRLTDFDRVVHHDDSKRRAAVALTIVNDGVGAGALILTRRTARLRHHSGQWALPGGRVDGDETLRQAALRELAEEVNLTLDDNAVLGLLDDYSTRSGFIMTPVVMWSGPGTRLRAEPDEVASIHRVSFRALAEPDAPQFVTIPESKRKVLRMRVNDQAINAPTAALMYQFREVCLLQRQTRVAHFEQPVFAWK